MRDALARPGATAVDWSARRLSPQGLSPGAGTMESATTGHFAPGGKCPSEVST